MEVLGNLQIKKVATLKDIDNYCSNDFENVALHYSNNLNTIKMDEELTGKYVFKEHLTYIKFNMFGPLPMPLNESRNEQ